MDEWLRRYTAGDIAFAQMPFDHPVFILFTSGTTGKPKCIVHGAGGTLLQSLKTYKLHFDVRPGDRFFYYCTTNWVVWNVLFMGLAAEASLMLYDGSPFALGGRMLFDYAEKERFTHFGTSAKSIDAARLLERPRWRALPRGVFCEVPERLVPWRLGRAHRSRHDDHLRPLRRDAEPGRRADRHRRDLSRGRAHPRGRGVGRDRAVVATGGAHRHARRAVREAQARLHAGCAARRASARGDHAP